MSLKIGDIVKHKYARGRNLGFFKVTRIGKGKLYSWAATKTDVIYCVLVSHLDGTIPKSKSLKERMWDSGNATKVTPEYIAKNKAEDIARYKRMIIDSAGAWDMTLQNLFPDSVEEHTVNDEVKEEFLKPLGSGLLRGGE